MADRKAASILAAQAFASLLTSPSDLKLDLVTRQPTPAERVAEASGAGMRPTGLWPMRDKPPGLMALLAKFTYKPGWSFALGLNEGWMGFSGGGSPFQWMLVIAVEDVLDAYGSGHRSTFLHTAVVPGLEQAEPATWVGWLKHQVDAAEMHEAGEWFVVDGQRPYDPHRGG